MAAVQWVSPWLTIFCLAGLVGAVLAHGDWRKRIAILILVPLVGTGVAFVLHSWLSGFGGPGGA